MAITSNVTVPGGLATVVDAVPVHLPRIQFSLVVPVYNEEERLSESGHAFAEFVADCAPGSELVVADDGSRDRTLHVAMELQRRYGADRVRVLELPHQGKGATVREGLLTARSAYAGFADVDLATPLHEIQRLLAAATTGPVVTIASRDVVTTTLVETEGAVREFLGKSYNRLVRVALTPGVHDTQCGAKVASRPVWSQILRYSREAGFAWDVEVIAIARRLGFAVWEVGVSWRHDSRSRVRPLRDGIAMVGAVPRIWRTVRVVESLTEQRSAVDLEPRPVGLPATLSLQAVVDAG
jgi:dolichyl-phosphate beta-glucosyltransferase